MRRYAISFGLAVAAALLLAAPAAAASGHAHPVLATDLFPVDDWVGDGLDKVKHVVFGGITLSANAIAQLLVNVLAALVDLLIPHQFVDAGLSAIKWLCTVPSFSGQQTGTPGTQLNLPHVNQLRETLTWIGVCALPLGLVYAGGRSVMTPSAYGDSPQEVLGRVVIAAAWLAFYVWGWQSITHFSGLVSNGVLSLPWISDGIDKLMGGLALVSGSLGPVSAFAVLLLGLVVGLALIGLLLMKVALLVITAFLFAIGGLIGALYPLPFGRRLVGGYVIAVVAVVALPALWAVLFALAAALMVDAHNAGGGGFNAFIAQFWVLGASLATFGLAIKLGFSAFGFASSTITSFTAGALLGGAGSAGEGRSPSATQTAHKAHSLYNVGSTGGARLGGGGAPGAAGGRTDGVQRTREPAEELRGAVDSGGAAKTAATAGAAAASGGASAAAGAAAKGGSAAASKAGGTAGGARSAAAKSAPKGGAERGALDRAASPPASGPSSSGEGVRSTGGEGEAPPAPSAQPAPPRKSARQTPRPAAPPVRKPGAPPAGRQRPPRGPRRSDGGKGR
jgi:hypothetical protein